MKKLLLLLLLWIVLVSQVNAGSIVSGEGSSTEGLVEILELFLNALSWLWIIPAVVAGTLMTNERVYGSAFNLDMYLWYLWNIMKNFANFTLAFVFLFVILKTFFVGQPGSVFKSYIPKIGLAAVLIQSSWFLVAVIIDITVISTAAVTSVPNQVISSMDTYDSYQVEIPNKCTVFFDMDQDDLPNRLCGEEGEDDFTLSVEDITVSANDASGPLIYMGMGILGFMDFQDPQTINLDEISIGSLIRLILVLLFFVPITILAIINFVRIFYLWMFIIFSPFIVLDSVFGNAVSGKMEGFTKKLTVSNFVGLAFQPVVVLGMLSIIMLFVVALHDFLVVEPGDQGAESSIESIHKHFNIRTDEIGSDVNVVSLHEDDKSGMISVRGSIIEEAGDFVGGFFGYLIISLFVCFMIWALIKVSFKTSEITSGVSDSIFKFSEDAMKAAPVLPGGQSVGALEQFKNRFGRDVFSNVQAKQMDNSELSKLANWGEKFGASTISTRQQDRLMRYVEQTKDQPDPGSRNFFGELRQMAKDGQSLSMRDPNLREAIEAWAKNIGKNIGEDATWLDQDGNVDLDNPDLSGLVRHMMQGGEVNPALRASDFRASISQHQDPIRNADLKDMVR
ncbi:hypothetical protein [Candidatus Absconditicoccus praedator]|uniref:hypothetical protein n=1 Tax=Candidatus Absconditicoccus praedator TaxID=2735562 RepID=UPI001E453311|nr:hypothetical protein [Candidatus Absconditicoccus praedator]UFX82839.1 hypothetical protein HLG78_01740 [Candidatus Absconditicoccus praedator]